MGSRNAGPAGSGLLPPGFEGSEEEEQDDEQTGEHGEGDVDLDGVPPVEGEDDGDEGDDGDDTEVDGEEDDSDDIEARLEAKFQRKFDQAIGRMHRNLERKYAKKEKPEEEAEEDDEPPVPPAGRSGRSTDRRRNSSDVTSIRLLAREYISDEMEDAGKQERAAVKQVVNKVLPHVDWSQVDDQDEFVEELVTTLKSVTADLVKTGSDRKVAQLKKAGVLQERPGQPGSAQKSGAKTQVGKKLEKGATAAQRRFPNGTRSLHSR